MWEVRTVGTALTPVDQLSGLETRADFTPDVGDFVFPDVDFTESEMPMMPRGNLAKLDTGLEGATKRHFEGGRR